MMIARLPNKMQPTSAPCTLDCEALFLYALHGMPPSPRFAVLCMLCFLCHGMLCCAVHALVFYAMTYASLHVCACAGLGRGKGLCLCLAPHQFMFACHPTHIVAFVIHAPCLQQCKRLEKKRVRQASDSASDTDRAAPAAGEPGYLSKLRRSISSLRSSRRYFQHFEQSYAQPHTSDSNARTQQVCNVGITPLLVF